MDYLALQYRGVYAGLRTRTTVLNGSGTKVESFISKSPGRVSIFFLLEGKLNGDAVARVSNQGFAVAAVLCGVSWRSKSKRSMRDTTR